MARPARLDLEGSWHHVMNRGVDHAPIFASDSDRVEFGHRLADIHDRFGVETHAYCLMDNHFHLLLHCPVAGLSAAMQRLASMFTRHVNDRVGRDGPLMRGRFHSRLVTDESYLLSACRYIHRNPLDRAGIDDVSAYRWSSHRTYLGYRSSPPWMKTAVVLDCFGGDVDAFDTFVRSDLRFEANAAPATAVDDLLAVAEIVVAEHAMTHGLRAAGLARTVTLLALDRMTGCSDEDVSMALGVPNAQALKAARRRSRASLDAEPALASVVDTLLSAVAARQSRAPGV